jgi:hypothetical protein
MINATPAEAPYPVAKYLELNTFEESKIANDIAFDGMKTNSVRSGPPANSSSTQEKKVCAIPVQIGLFFDGTNNNLPRDRDGKRTGLINSDKKSVGTAASPTLTDAEYSHSNVAKLFESFPLDKQTSGYHSYYMPGVGTPFPEIGEPTESDNGKAFALGSLPRIIWGLLQLLNGVHLTLSGGAPLYQNDEVGRYAVEYEKQVGGQKTDIYDRSTTVTHQAWFDPHLAKLKGALASQRQPEIPSLTLSVFGFSRGAAEAIGFCHLFAMLLDNDTFAGIKASIRFLGVFDTVATVGKFSDSIARTTIAPGILVDGHGGWAAHILKPLPDCIKNARHFIAAHEQRMNFPVTRQRGKNIREIYFPGMHSDVGGGYGPGDQGKGRGSQSAMLSQISLAYMYKEARKAGVPLTPYSEMEQRTQRDYAVSPELASAWEAYTTALGKNGDVLLEHMGLYYRWRAARLHTLEETASFKAASPQDQQDLREANNMLMGDLEALAVRRKTTKEDRQKLADGDRTKSPPPLPSSAISRMNQWQYRSAQTRTPLTNWEIAALAKFEKPEPLPADVMRFFDDYVHDSFAGFYLAGAVTEFDKRKTTAEIRQKQAKNPASLSPFEKRAYTN